MTLIYQINAKACRKDCPCCYGTCCKGTTCACHTLTLDGVATNSTFNSGNCEGNCSNFNGDYQYCLGTTDYYLDNCITGINATGGYEKLCGCQTTYSSTTTDDTSTQGNQNDPNDPLSTGYYDCTADTSLQGINTCLHYTGIRPEGFHTGCCQTVCNGYNLIDTENPLYGVPMFTAGGCAWGCYGSSSDCEKASCSDANNHHRLIPGPLELFCGEIVNPLYGYDGDPVGTETFYGVSIEWTWLNEIADFSAWGAFMDIVTGVNEVNCCNQFPVGPWYEYEAISATGLVVPCNMSAATYTINPSEVYPCEACSG